MEKKCYIYSGPVLKFNAIIANNWMGTTWAVSEKQAASNLAFQYKKEAGLVPATKIKLANPPKIKRIRRITCF